MHIYVLHIEHQSKHSRFKFLLPQFNLLFAVILQLTIIFIIYDLDLLFNQKNARYYSYNQTNEKLEPMNT